MATGIMIIGPSGSGKTTLGRLVADELGYPYFDVDDYIWRKDTKEPYSVMYSRDEKIEGLEKDPLRSFAGFIESVIKVKYHNQFKVIVH